MNVYFSQEIISVNVLLIGLAEWSTPTGGMYLWLKLLNVEDSFRMITVKAPEKEVLFVPGSAFMVDDTQPCPYVRASYSNVTAEQMDMVGPNLTIRNA